MQEEKKKLIKAYTYYTLIIVIGIVLDQLTKFLAVKYLKPISTSTFIKSFISFTYHENTGAAFGIFKNNRWVFMVISTVAIVALSVFLYMRKAPNKLYATAIALIVSGGIGNMIDRIFLGYVVDFIEPTFMNFAIFNVADSFVTVGAFGLILLLLIDIIKEARQNKKGSKNND